MANPTPNLETAFRKTDALLRKGNIRHLYIGGLAVLAAGEPRMTRDIDLIIFISRKALPQMLGLASRSGFTVIERVAIRDAKERGACMIQFKGVPVDLILASTDLEASAWKRRRRLRLFGRLVNMPSIEDLILLKIIPGRPRDIEDARGIVVSAGSGLDRPYLRLWCRRICDEAEDMRVWQRLKEVGIS